MPPTLSLRRTFIYILLIFKYVERAMCFPMLTFCVCFNPFLSKAEYKREISIKSFNFCLHSKRITTTGYKYSKSICVQLHRNSVLVILWCIEKYEQTNETRLKLKYVFERTIRLSEKCLSFTDTSFTTTHLYTNMKPNPSNVVLFILIEQNGSYVIR